METLQKMSSRIYRSMYAFCVIAVILSCQPAHSTGTTDENPPPVKEQNVMIALLLDTSNSMDGLIEQAKSQLWKIVNELAAAKCSDGAKPNIKIALYEYGNDRLVASEGYIRQVSGLTTDLDLISERLFSLTTNGGSEFCGHVIKTSLQQLEWSASDSDLKMIFIAGNEPFTQGEIGYRFACSLAKEKDVVVNTIYCGEFNEGLASEWKAGADLTGGTYMSISQNTRTVYVPSPYDDQIAALNTRLNDTYVYYGKSGASKKAMQATQDKNAGSYGNANTVERTVSKSSHVYKNESWDLVDAAKDNKKVVESASEEELPQEMKGMSGEQRKAYVDQKANDRAQIQAEIQALSKKRQQYIADNKPKNSTEVMLDDAMIKAIKTKAKEKKLDW
jgi:hypothetical protein